jgi:hypothetical protein
MPDFNIPVTASTKEVAAAQYLLDKANERITELNEDRAEQGLELLPLWASVLEFITDHNQKLIASWQKTHEDALKKEMDDLWDVANDTMRDDARIALGG